MAKLDKDERDKLKDSDFGIPSKRAYPIHDKAHVEAAVKLFGHASNEDKPELAYRILQKAKEFGMDSSGWTQVNLWAKKYKGESTNESADSKDENDYEDLTDGITEGFFDRFKKKPTSELSDDEYFDKIRAKTTLATNLFDEFKRIYSSERYQNLLELSKTNKLSFSSPTENTFNIELLTAKEINEYCWDDSEMEEMYGFQFAAGLGSADDITFGIGIKDGSILMSGEKVANNISDFLKKLNKSENINEAAAGASLLTVKNQLMKLVGNAFKFIGGSLVPKFTMQSTEKPAVAFDVNTNGQNVEVTPKYNGVADTLHKKKGIAFMRAAEVIADFADNVVSSFKSATPATESFEYNNDYFYALLEYANELMDECELEAYLDENPEMGFAICIGEDCLYDEEDFEAYFEGTEYDGVEETFIEFDDVFTETAHPYDDYLRKHQYDPASNTIIINGKRRDAGQKGSKKERNRLNKFLREHDYDPKTETIGSDIPDGAGGFKRIPFGITFIPGSEHRMSYKSAGPAASYRRDPRINDPNQPVGITVNKRTLQGKPNQASTVVAHELGHEAYASDPQAYQMAYKYGERHAQDAAKKYPDLATNIHDMNPEEYVADRYAVTHNPYNRKPGDFKRSLAPFMANYYASVRKMLKKQVAAAQKGMEEEGMTMTAEDFDNVINIDEIREFTQITIDSINEQIAEFQKILAENPNDSVSQYQLQNLIASKKQLEEEIANDFPKTRAAFESMKQNASNMAGAIDASMDQQQVMIQAGLNSRLDHAAKIENERQAEETRANAQKRHELRAQLQAQIDSGRLSPKQVQQAQKKISRIDAFDAREQSGTPAPKSQPKKRTATSKSKKPSETASKKTETTKKGPAKTEKPEATEKKAEPTPKKTEKPTPKESSKKSEEKPKKEYFTDIDYNETFLCRIDNHELDIENLKKINDDSAIVAWDEEKDIQYMRDHDMMSNDDENFDRVLVPSEEAIKYFKNNKELSSYWEDIAKASEGEFLVTKDTREEIGHVFVHTNKKDTGFIYNVNVEKKFRRKGFGWILVDDAVKKFNGEDLTVDADNTPAVNLYLKYGFKIVDRGYWHNTGKEELWMKYDRSKLKQESFQEGASQDIRNGVNPNSKKLFFHVTSDPNLDGQVFKPRVPDYLDEYDPEDKCFENTTTPRVCFSPSIEGCINAIAVNFMRINPIRFEKLYVYIPEKPIQEYRHKTNKELIRDKDVFDANVTREMWILEPVRLKLYGVIRIDQWKKVHRKSTVPTIKNEKDTRPYYTIKWHWLVKPKVVASTEKSQYNYDVKSVCTNLGTDLNKFRYGLIRNGKLITSNNSEEDYDKYWVMHSAQEVDEAGGGNCYDMVEYEADYLESYGVKCNKYYISATYHGRLFTHTFVVVPDGDKFIYIERAFKRISDEFTDNKREFDNLNDIFNYIIECMCEYESVPELDYIVIDYTDCTPKVGTDIKHFQDYIVNHGDEVAGDNFKLKKK